MKKLALFTRYRRSGGTSTPFGQLGPTLDLNFAGAPTTGLVSNNNSLDLNFVDNAYTLGAPYMVWGNDGMQAANFEDIVTFSRATGNATYYNSSGYLTLAGVLNYLTYSNQPENAAWTKSNSFIQQNLLTYSNQPENAAWTKSNSFVQQNVFIYSQEFDNANWALSGVSTPTANTTIAPDGTLTADTVTATASTTQHLINQATAGLTATPITISIYAKANTHNFLQIFHGALLTNYANFNISTGVVGTVGAGFTSASMNSVGNGWFRCIVTLTPTAFSNARFALVTSNTAVYNESWTTAGTESVYLWGAQCVQGSVPGDYRATTSAALPCLYADYNGALRARKLCEDATASVAHYINQSGLSMTAGSVFTHSEYFKIGERSKAYINLRYSSLSQYYITAVYDLTTETVSETSVGSTSGVITGTAITNLGNGWYRCTISGYSNVINPFNWVLIGTTTAATGNTFTSQGGISFTGDGSSGIYIADAQLVQGSVPGDYRETTTAALPVLYADYNGALRARKLCEDATASTIHFLNRSAATPGIPQTLYVVAKAAERSQLAIQLGSASGYYNLATGAVISGANARIESAGNGYFRCIISGTPASNNSQIYIADGGAASYTGNGSSGIYIADAQLNNGTSALSYYDTSANPHYEPRFDYDPVTLAAKGLLIEELRQNLLLQSNDFLTSWSPTNITRTLNSTLSPSGNVDGVKLAATTGASTTLFQTSIVSATSATVSVYVKQGTSATTANTFILRNFTTATNLIGGTLNYSTGVFTYTIGSTGVVVTNAGNGWWRVAITATAGITAGNSVGIYPGWGGGVATAGDFLYAYGAQLEAGAFATSYIPTTTSQLTRAADVASVNTLSPWFNQAAGTFYAEFAGGNSVSGIYGRAIGYDGSRAFIGGNGAVTALSSWNGAVNLGATLAGNILTGAKTAMAYSSAGRALVGNAGTVATDVSLVGTVTDVKLGNSVTSSEYLNGHLRRITYYPRRLTDTELQTLTTL